ncbi:hypothetical protein Tco_1067395 [Tanacetum coccineum]|uniref:Uncharacterized protein n=1 Tax=Tanacetum coccineum TaxID=301880 RepID=A0ABQ5HCY9_9ASTR
MIVLLLRYSDKKHKRLIGAWEALKGLEAFGREASNGRASMDFNWLINDKPELVDAHLSLSAFVKLRLKLSLKDICKLVLAFGQLHQQ